MEIRIREATVEDYDAMCELFDEIDRLHREALPHIYQKTGGAVRERDYYLGLVADEHVGIFIAEVGSNLVGLVQAEIRETPDIPVLVPRCYAIVDNIVVKSEYHDQGIGKILMDKMHAWASANGVASIELNVYEFNHNALSFYKRLGYQTLSRRMRKEINTDDSTGDNG
jgi:diamine N-acetyltransferase